MSLGGESRAVVRPKSRSAGMKFSLKTLLCLVMLLTCAIGLYHRWSPWHHERSLVGHTAQVMDASFSPDGRKVVTASDDGTARIWDSASGESVHVLRGHQGAVSRALFSPSGSRVVTVSLDDGNPIATPVFDNSPRIWNAATGKLVRVLKGHQDAVWAAAFSPDGSRVATTSADRSARLWDVESGRCLFVLAGHEGSIWDLAFSPCGKRVATGSKDGTARVWDTETGSQLAVLEGHTGEVRSVRFSPDGTRLVTASDDKTARIWDAATYECMMVLKRHQTPVGDAAFLPGGGALLTVGRVGHLWDTESGEELAVLDSEMTGAVISADGRRIVSRNRDGAVTLWDAQSGRRMARFWGRSEWAAFARSSPDGSRIVTAGLDDTMAHIWRRVRPEYRWGVAALPEFWLTIFFAALLIWSLYRDRRYFRALAAKQAESSS